MQIEQLSEIFHVRGLNNEDIDQIYDLSCRNTIFYQGRSLGEWCERLGLNYKEVYRKIFDCHWTFERALSLPIDEQPTK